MVVFLFLPKITKKNRKKVVQCRKFYYGPLALKSSLLICSL